MTHAFFKALLFLAAGSVIIGMHHDQDIRNMGGLRKYMPITWITSLVGSLALIGTPVLRRLLLEGLDHRGGAREPSRRCRLRLLRGRRRRVHHRLLFVSACTSWSSMARSGSGTRAFPPEEAHDEPTAHGAADGHGDDAHATHRRAGDAHGAHGDEHHDPHESPWVVTLPLVLLAIPSVVIGAMTIAPMLYGDFFKGAIRRLRRSAPGDARGSAKRSTAGSTWRCTRSAGPVFLAGAGRRGRGLVSSTCAGPTFRPCCSGASPSSTSLLDNKYYFDWFNEHVLARGARMLGTALWKGGDVGIIDGVFIDGSASTIGSIARATPPPAERLPVLVRAGNDRRRHRPDDLAVVAVHRQLPRALIRFRPTTRTCLC